MPPQTAPASPLAAGPSAAGTPASWDDVIRVLAEKEGVPVPLALAVATKESNRNPNAVGDGGKAIGMFQLHAAAAEDVGADRANPVENIRGGLRYLKQLNGRYGGDVTKVLQAYNGGMDNVDKGTVSPAAQAYAAEVIANLSKNIRETQARMPGGGAPAAPSNVRVAGAPAATAPTAARGTGSANIGTAAAAMASGFDPRKPEGRQNLAATAGSIGGTLLFRGLPVTGLLTKIAQVVGPALSAGVAAGTEVATEQALGVDAYANDPSAAVKAGATQGALEIGGSVFMWPLRRLTRALVAPGVAKATKDALTRNLDVAKQTGDALVTRARTAGRQLVDTVTRQTDATVRAMKQQTTATIDQTVVEGAEHLAHARTVAATAASAVELKTAAEVAELTKQYDDLLSQAPGKLATGATVREMVTGPIRQALKLAGERVEQAALSGPPVNTTAMVETLKDITAKAKPDSLFGGVGARNAGFVPPGTRALAVTARPAAMPAATIRMSPAEFAQAIKGELTKPAQDRLPLPQILQIAARAPEEIAFRDAHALKMLLDERVTWDRPAKAINERLTKATRQALRASMTGNGEYDAATAAYQAVAPLYKKGAGKRIQQLTTTPDGIEQLATMLNARRPASAMVLKNLLLDQAAAGGDALGGQRAWNSVRSVFTYDHLIRGGVAGLEKRLDALVTEQPDFAKVVFGDASGKEVLSNLATLASAFKTATVAGAENLARAKAIGKAGVSEAKDVVAGATRQVKRDAAEAVSRTQAQAATKRLDATRTSNQAVTAAKARAQQGIQSVKEDAARFGASTLGKATSQTAESVLSDVARAAALGTGSYWGNLSIIRLLRSSPRADDIVEWAAYSNYNTSRLARALMSDLAPPATAALMRDIATVITGGSSASPGSPAPVTSPAPAMPSGGR